MKTFDELKIELLQDAEIREEYERLRTEFELAATAQQTGKKPRLAQYQCAFCMRTFPNPMKNKVFNPRKRPRKT